MGKLVQLLEFTRISKAARIDEAAGVLYGLAILGPTSANGRHYPESTMRKALPLFEGRQSFANHGRRGEDPSAYDVLGVWGKPRFEDGKVRGDLSYFKSHMLSERLVEAARRPELNNALGFSINGSGRESRQSGRTIIEAIEQLVSVDCVAQPATVGGLYESREGRMPMKLRAIIERLKRLRPGYARGLREAETSGILSPDYQMDEPADEPAEGGEAADHEQAILDAAKAVLDDDALDSAAKLAKIKKLLKIIDDGDGDAGDDDVEESRRRRSGRGKALVESRWTFTGEHAAEDRLRQLRTTR